MASKITDPHEISTLGEINPPIELKATTQATYRTLYARCMRRAISKRESNPDEPVHILPTDLVDDWLAEFHSAKTNTTNMQRSALLWMFQKEQMPEWQVAHERLKAIRPGSLRNTGSNEEEESDRRSREPGRMIPQEHLVLLSNYLAGKRSWGPRTQWFLMAGIASGARSVEWPDAEWADDAKTILRIYTAKVKARNAWHKIPPMTFTAEDLDNEVDQLWGQRNTRIPGVSTSWHEVDFERRIATLDLTDEECEELRSARVKNGVLLFRDVYIEPEYQPYVRLHMDAVRQVIDAIRQDAGPDSKLTSEEIFKEHYFEKVRHCIWRACKRVFKSKGEMLYSLADTRSTFSANRKAQVGVKGAAQDLGHSVTTSKAFYAPASKAWNQYRQGTAPAADQKQTQGAAPSNAGASPAGGQTAKT